MDVQVIPATLGGKLVELEPQCLVRLSSCNQPATFGFEGVVTCSIRDETRVVQHTETDVTFIHLTTQTFREYFSLT